MSRRVKSQSVPEHPGQSVRLSTSLVKKVLSFIRESVTMKIPLGGDVTRAPSGVAKAGRNSNFEGTAGGCRSSCSLRSPSWWSSSVPGQSREWNQRNVSIRGEIAPAVSSGTSNCISGERDVSRIRQWILVRGLPAASVFVLVVWQLVALADDGVIVVHHPTWPVVLACVRGCLYACFLSIPVAAFLLHGPPLEQDSRTSVRAAGIVATFLLIALGLFAPSALSSCRYLQRRRWRFWLSRWQRSRMPHVRCGVLE